MTLPASVAGIVRQKPTTDLVVAVLRHYLPGVPVRTAFEPESNDVPLIIVNKSLFPNPGQGELRWIMGGSLGIDSFASGLNADEDAEMMSQACFNALRRGYLENWYRPDVGRIQDLVHVDGPLPGSDWAPALGPVQFADSPYHIARSRIMVQVAQRVY